MLLPERIKRVFNQRCPGCLGGASDTSFGSVHVMRFSPVLISLLGGFALLLFCCVPGVFAAKSDYKALTLHVIDEDHVGAPISFPSTIAYDSDSDEIYVTDAAKGQVIILAADYFPRMAVGAGRGLQAIYSSHISDGLIYFCVGRDEEGSRGHIAVYNAALLPVKKIFFTGLPDGEGFMPRKVVVGKNGLLYVVGVNSSSVKVLDQEGNYLREIQPRDEVLGVPEDASILSLTVGDNGNFYFLSEARGRVFVYDEDENFLYKFGQKGGGDGKLARPRGIAVDDERGRIFIADYLRHAVSLYSMDGTYLSEFGGLGVSRGWFNFPTDVCVDGRGHVLVTDTFNHRVQVFKVTDLTRDDAPVLIVPMSETP